MAASVLNFPSRAELKRWYRLRDHPVQLALVHDDVRFKTVPAGRRSGKTERFKRYVVKQAMRLPGGKFFAAAPTRPQVKKIFWDDLKLLSFSSTHNRPPSETELIIYLNNGAEIHLIGLDTPARIEGIPWDGGGVDEIADVKPQAWPLHIYPALNTFNPTRPDYKPWCWLLGVPEGLNHYYELCTHAASGKDPEWRNYHWISADILPPDRIDAFKRAMSKQQYAQEFEASFETAQGRIYADYGPANHTTETIQPHEQLHWMHDFNYSPMSSAVGVRRGHANRDLFILDEIILQSAVARQTALEFVEKFKDHQNKALLLYGDPAGRAGEKHGHASDYTEIETVLRQHGWSVQRKVKAAAPAIRDRQNAVRAKIANAAGEISLYVNTAKAPYCHKGLSTVQLKPGSTFLENETEYQHVTTAIGYMVDVEWPVRSTKEPAAPEFAPSTNHYNKMR